MICKHMKKIMQVITGQGRDYTTGCLLDYPYFKENYKQKAIHLSKQKSFDADPNAIQQINFNVNLDYAPKATILFILEEVKETILDFTVRMLTIYC